MDLKLRNQYNFRTDIFDVIIGGKSTLDSPNFFQVATIEEATKFISNYGYDLENSIEKAELLGNFHEALNFIRKFFLQPENPEGIAMEIPQRIIELTDVRELLLIVSNQLPGQEKHPKFQHLQNWACSILKVMHTISHIDKDVRTSYFPDIQKQIFDRFYKLICRDQEGQLYLGERDDDPNRINLVAFETKPKKSRDSTILKLLHKPENVAEDIFDRVGIRFITKSPLDALRVVKYLKDKMVIMPPNIKPSRSRNTLIQVDDFREKLERILNQADQGKLSEEVFAQELEKAAHPPYVNPANPHSSEFYRAIQFTCRQLIKLKNSLYEDLKELKLITKEQQVNESILKVMDRIDLKTVPRDIRFFYPFEVQIVDQKSAEDNEKGRSAHSEYKKAQIQTALKRVMGGLGDGVR